ncbi:hypothetical protein S14_111 [Shewanella sp. phage 1/4]|uniref:ATPase n=1 Tax=Shewanella phage 1/4 TaxID=1458859 RepID=UPI0004F6CBED|nr:ATPase [Shewanella sp. phage 1/4]AHK11220.1 hypothetical protein S14_111 [Shewanella sp. phage 1/4]
MGHGFNIVVHNTNTSERELKPYLKLAEEHSYEVVSLVVENRHGNHDMHNAQLRQEERLLGSLVLF